METEVGVKISICEVVGKCVDVADRVEDIRLRADDLLRRLGKCGKVWRQLDIRGWLIHRRTVDTDRMNCRWWAVDIR